jgi:hypothetical protein
MPSYARSRRGVFRSGGLRPFGGGFLDTSASAALPGPPEPITPPAREQAPPRVVPGVIPVPNIPPITMTPPFAPPKRRQITGERASVVVRR